MSETQEHTPSECDSLLDYVYGELSGDALEQFKLHLLTCEKCKRELAGLERVRTAVKQAMPQVEPPADKMSQLLHAAAQQKPKRGKVLMFARRVVSHPAYMAAAVVVIVGGAMAYNFRAGRVMMPAAEPELHEAVATKMPVAATPPVEKTQTAVAGGELPAGAPEGKIEGKMAEPAREIAKPMESFASHSAAEPKIVLKTDAPAEYGVTRSSRKNVPGAAFDGRPAVADKGYLEKGKDSSLRAQFDDNRNNDGVISRGDELDLEGGAGGGKRRHASGGGLARTEAEKNVISGAGVAMKPAPVVAAAPPPPAPEPQPAKPQPAKKMAKAEEERTADRDALAQNQGRVQNHPSIAQNPSARAQAAAAPAPASVAPPAAPAPATAAMQQPSQQKEMPSNEAPALAADNKARSKQNGEDPAALKKRMLAYADNGDCEQARKLYEQIDKQFPSYLTSADRVNYSRCSGVNRGVQTAEQQQPDQENSSNSKATVAKSGKKAKKAAPNTSNSTPPASSAPAEKAADKAAY
jgi:Putative zinc-finger